MTPLSFLTLSSRGNILRPLQMGEMRLGEVWQFYGGSRCGTWEWFPASWFLAYLAAWAQLFSLHHLNISSISQKIYIFLLPLQLLPNNFPPSAQGMNLKEYIKLKNGLAKQDSTLTLISPSDSFLHTYTLIKHNSPSVETGWDWSHGQRQERKCGHYWHK